MQFTDVAGNNPGRTWPAPGMRHWAGGGGCKSGAHAEIGIRTHLQAGIAGRVDETVLRWMPNGGTEAQEA